MATPLPELCLPKTEPSGTDPASWTAVEVVAAIAARSISCVEVAQACLTGIVAAEPEVLAWQHLDPEMTLATARELDRQRSNGPLQGVPFGVKDIIDTVDMPTEWGTPIHGGRQPGRDAACVALARKAGAVLLGKTVTTEFANVSPGPTKNPLDPLRTPGGSSSGSAAAVAAGMVPLAIGTQTTGSTIRPASFCGTFGYRPTYGDLRTSGVMEASGSLDTLGILARSVDDVNLFRDVLLGVGPTVLKAVASPPRIGFCKPYFWPRLSSDTRRLLQGAADRLAESGAEVVEISLPPFFEGLEEAHRWISGFEMARNLTWEIENRWDAMSERFRSGRILDGLNCPYDVYMEMQDRAATARRSIDDLFKQCDVLLAPAAAGEAPLGLEDPVSDPWVYMMWTVLHVPSTTVPALTGSAGLPIGAQLVGRPHHDRALLAASKWVHQTLV